MRRSRPGRQTVPCPQGRREHGSRQTRADRAARAEPLHTARQSRPFHLRPGGRRPVVAERPAAAFVDRLQAGTGRPRRSPEPHVELTFSDQTALRPRRGAVSFADAATIGGVAPWTPDPRLHPRFPLVDGGSPLTRLPRFAAALGDRCDIWIKREDLLPLAFGGNKIRSLEYLVGAALAEGADCLVTTGRRWSNHARLTAAAGARAGLEVHLVLSGPRTKPPNPGVVLDELLGATVHHAATADRAERSGLLDDVVAELRAGGRKPHVIPTGGGSVTGAIGQVTAALELLADGRAHDVAFDDVIVPSATGGTQAGLLVGARTGGSPMTIHGVAVVAPDELHAAVTGLVAGLAGVPGLARVPDAEIVIDPTQLGDGYGRRTVAADEATRLLARTEGILVDPIYTAKAVAAVVALARSGTLDGRRAVFWHAGGTPGLFEPIDADDD